MKVKCLIECKAKISNGVIKSYSVGEVYDFSEKEENIFAGSGKFEYVVEAPKQKEKIENKIINPVEETKEKPKKKAPAKKAKK